MPPKSCGKSKMRKFSIKMKKRQCCQLFVTHSVEISRFYGHFYVKSILVLPEVQKLPFLRFLRPWILSQRNFCNFTKFKNQRLYVRLQKKALFELRKRSNLISRKIWVAEKSTLYAYWLVKGGNTGSISQTADNDLFFFVSKNKIKLEMQDLQYNVSKSSLVLW